MNKFDYARRLRSVAATALAGTLLASCAIFDPHVTVEKPTPEELQLAADSEINSFPEAELYANKTKAAYRDALGDYAEFNRWLGVGLIPLGAATLGLGITGASEAAVTALGLTGATGLGIGTWLQSPAIQRAYILGHNAVSCAVEAMLPFKIDEKSMEFENFSEALYGADPGNDPDPEIGVDRRIEEVEKAIGWVNHFLDGETQVPPARRQRAETAVTAARGVIDNAKQARRNGVNLSLEIALAGSKLATAVDEIIGEVDLAILNEQPTLEALVSIIGSLGQSYTQFTSVPDSLRSAGDMAGTPDGDANPLVALQTDDPDGLVVAVTQLLERTAELSSTTRKIADFVNAIVEDKPVENLEKCGVRPEDVASALTIDPAGPLVFTSGAAASQGFQIKGGRAPYDAVLADGAVKGLSISKTTAMGSGFLVKAAEDAAPGEYTVVATDGAGRNAPSLKVTVNKKPDPPQNNQ